MISCIGIIVINIVCYYMVVRLSKANVIRIEHEMLLFEANYRKHYAEDAKAQYDEIRNIRHDMKQSYTVIRQLVMDERYDELKKYLPQMREYINSTESTVMTEHAVVDAILNTKLSTAKKQGIQTLCNVSKNLHIKSLEEIDLCHLLGNMLDNAIEAAVQCSDEQAEEEKAKYIEVSITEKNKTLIITVKNSFDHDKLHPDMQTSKDDKAVHGYGVKTIRRISKKYNGIADYYIEDDFFCCTVTMQM